MTIELIIGLALVAALAWLIGHNVSRCAGLANLNSIVGWPLLVISLLFIAANAPANSGRIAIPILHRYLGLMAACGLIAFEAVLVFLLRNRRGLLLFGAFLVLGAVLGWLAMALDPFGVFQHLQVTRERYMLCAGAACSGLALAIGLLHLSVRRQQRW